MAFYADRGMLGTPAGAPPGAHAASHADAGSDEISVAGLSGELADDQPPKDHAADHDAGGSDAMAIDAAAGTGSLRTIGTASTAACAGDDARLSDARTPTSHATSHDAGGGDAMAADAAAGTASLRSLGATSTTACAGDDSRLSDARTPTAHNLGGSEHGADTLANLNAKVSDATLIDTADSRLSDARTPTSHASSHDSGGGDAMAIDAAAGTGSLRTLGTASTAACAGDDSRLTDARAPTSHASSHDAGGGDAMAADAAAGTASLRSLGLTATTACAGDDSRLSDARTPTSHNLAGSEHAADTLANLNSKVSDATLIDTGDSRLSDARTPTAHKTSHQNGGADELSVADLSGVLADSQTQNAHGNWIYVSKSGSDSTGARQDPSRSFLTIAAANAVATAGDSVIVAAGNYTEDVVTVASVKYFALAGATVTSAAGGGTSAAFTMAASVIVDGFDLAISATSGGTATGADFGSAAANTTSQIRNCRIVGTGAGDTNGVDLSGVTGVADESHFCAANVTGQLVSESGARGIVGGGTASTNHAHVKDCSFVVVGTGGVGCEVVGLITAIDSYFWGTSSGVLNASPSANNVLRYTPGTRWNTVSGAGGYTRLAGFEHSLRGNAVFADTTVGDDNTAIISDASRPYATLAAAVAVVASGDVIYAAPGTYAESVVLPAGVTLWAPGATITNIVVGNGAKAVVGTIAPGAVVAGLLVSSATAQVYVDNILLSGNNTSGLLTVGTAVVEGRIGRIVESGSPTTTTGISTTGTGSVTLSVGKIDADTAWNVGTGTTLNMFVGDSAGTEGGAGTINVTKAGVVNDHASDHEPGGSDALTVDAAAGVGSLRTIGTGALTACAGNDSRLSDDRTADAIKHSTGSVSMGIAVAPVAGQVLTAFSPAFALWSGYVPAVIPTAGTPTALTNADYGKLFTNEGASAQSVFNLPAAVLPAGFLFYVQDATYSIKINAAGGDTIRVLGSVSAAAGNIVSTAQGDYVQLIAVNAAEWIAIPSGGTWNVT